MNKDTDVTVSCSECNKKEKFRSLKEAYFDGWEVKNWSPSDTVSLVICPECSKTAWVRD